jgi:GDPmannose 4,6-dehydratase
MKTAIITGVAGQDGSYLAEFLLQKGYEVTGVHRRSSQTHFDNIKDFMSHIRLIDGDITDAGFVSKLVQEECPDEVYNLAAQSHVATSFSQPSLTFQVNLGGVLNLLEAVKQFSPYSKFYQASTSELFGKVQETPQTEKTPFYPRSPYGVSKLAAHTLTINYRESYDLFACSGILFNHESERRGDNFVTKRIAKQIAEIAKGKRDKLVLGNVDARRDWGYAPDYVEAMWLMLQQDAPEDYVIATGETHSVEDFIVASYKAAGLDNLGYTQDPKLLRPAEVDYLRGDYTKAKTTLNWQPKTTFEQLVEKMVNCEIKNL